jgi:hypothetical protein
MENVGFPAKHYFNLQLFNSFPGLMLFIHGFSGHPPSTNNVQSMTTNNSGTDVKNNNGDDDDDFDGSNCCGHCGRGGKKKKRGMSCTTLLFLLAIDAFTIALLLILFYSIKNLSGNYSLSTFI